MPNCRLTSNLGRFVLAIAAAFRLAQMVAYDEGPNGLFLQLRIRAGAYNLGADGKPQTNLGRLVLCPYCIGVYTALLCVLVLQRPNRFTDVLLAWLGVAGLQAFMQGLID